MIKQLAHICVHTEDLKETERFYCEVLGLEKGFIFEKNNELFGYYIKLGNDSFIEVFKGKPGKIGNINHLAIETDDIDQIITTLRSNGFDATDKKLGCDHTWQTWAKDPNGVRIEFHQYTDESFQFKGGVCKVDW
ncbi:VOC family protein [Rhodohalobacter barkolensis]|uniref:Lactoylglutathione lyase n=1 Tax=Rhodohalobacter barkolensis TaxID=2053187 RepID=A0A2N0VJV1_9BACT|nr:VOC family protein [Rhodohalobacter barkolensis]PKD44477.1 lactoylglutathione lyase [Rhodohalobacter barkolensis]